MELVVELTSARTSDVYTFGALNRRPWIIVSILQVPALVSTSIYDTTEMKLAFVLVKKPGSRELNVLALGGARARHGASCKIPLRNDPTMGYGAM